MWRSILKVIFLVAMEKKSGRSTAIWVPANFIENPLVTFEKDLLDEDGGTVKFVLQHKNGERYSECDFGERGTGEVRAYSIAR